MSADKGQLGLANVGEGVLRHHHASLLRDGDFGSIAWHKRLF